MIINFLILFIFSAQADGANLLAQAVAPVGGIIMWRAFVYGGPKMANIERAKQAYVTFMPLDGKFDDNVVVQIKNGPMDFQVREPISPLLAGALKHTNLMMEVQATQEYTGQQIHAVGLTAQWKSYLDFDTMANASATTTTVASLLTGRKNFGMACVSNFGNWANVTGHVLAASNSYGFGRLAWDPTLSAAAVHREWAAMTFPAPAPASASERTAGGGGRSRTEPGLDNGGTPRSLPSAVEVVGSILDRSWLAFEAYTSPLGIGFMCSGCGGWSAEGGGGCAPRTKGPGPGPDGAECPLSVPPDATVPWGHPGGLEDGHQAWHYFIDPCDNYRQSNYSTDGAGCDRTVTGTNYAEQYAPALAALLNDPRTCPRELLMFFHNLKWYHDFDMILPFLPGPLPPTPLSCPSA